LEEQVPRDQQVIEAILDRRARLVKLGTQAQQVRQEIRELQARLGIRE